jgi:hypothetical protein
MHRVAPADPVLQTLLRKRVEIYTWLDGPVKQAYLAKINRMIEQHNGFQVGRLGHVQDPRRGSSPLPR